MIRFLDLKGQIEDNYTSFAFFDTICGQILKFDGENVFDSLENFAAAYYKSYMNEPETTRPLERFTSLIPNKYFD